MILCGGVSFRSLSPTTHLHGERDIAVSGDDDDRQLDAAPREMSQQLDAIHVRHPHIGHDAAAGLVRRAQESRRGIVGRHSYAFGLEQERHRIPDGVVVVDHVNGIGFSRHPRLPRRREAG